MRKMTKGQHPETTWHMIARIWKSDPNFRRYLIARSLCFWAIWQVLLAVYAIQRFNLSDSMPLFYYGHR